MEEALDLSFDRLRMMMMMIMCGGMYCVGFVMCGCFGNMFTCVLYCLYYVFVLFRLCIFIQFMLVFNFVSYVFLLL